MGFRWIAIFLMLAWATAAQAQVVRAQLDPDSSQTYTGSTLGLRWVANIPMDAVLEEPNLEEWLAETKFDFLAAQPVDTLLRQGQITYSQYFYILAEKEGSFELPALAIRYQLGPATEKVETRPLELTVRERPTPKGMEDYIADNKPLQREPVHWSDYIVWILLGGVFLLLLIAGYVLWKRPDLWKRTKPVPATTLAREELQALQQKGYIEQEAYADYYAELSTIARRLIQRETGFAALASGSTELRNWSAKGGLPTKQHKDFEEFLLSADLVKFAKATPLPEGIRFVTAHVEQIISYYEAKNSEAE